MKLSPRRRKLSKRRGLRLTSSDLVSYSSESYEGTKEDGGKESQETKENKSDETKENKSTFEYQEVQSSIEYGSDYDDDTLDNSNNSSIDSRDVNNSTDKFDNNKLIDSILGSGNKIGETLKGMKPAVLWFPRKLNSKSIS